MSWINHFSEDLRRYRRITGRGTIANLLMEQGLWALLVYRVGAAIYRNFRPGPLRRISLGGAAAGQKLIEILTGISLPYRATIGPGLYIGHFGNIIVHPEAVIGRECNLSQGVTIGISGWGQRRGAPVIGNRVFIAPNAVVVGKITVGDDALISANTLVYRNVPEHVTVMGVPARIISQRGSERYLYPGTATPDDLEEPVAWQVLS